VVIEKCEITPVLMMVSMVKLVGVGDNTVDRYIHLNRMFPGGNSVNVPVLARRYSHESAYIGWLGDDPHGQLLYDSMRCEEVDLSRCRMVEGPNSYCEVRLVSGERIFGKSASGVSSQIKLERDDYRYISEYDITHTSVYSFLEEQLEELSKASERLSFDYSDRWSNEYLTKTAPNVDIAFLSASEQTKNEAENLICWVNKMGVMLVVATQGTRGSLVYDGEQVYHQPIVETEVVDTLGAGDAFAARLMVEYFSGRTIEDSMRLAASSASETCGYYGAWDYGAPIWEIN
jgi:fructoselysine 6-kinase